MQHKATFKFNVHYVHVINFVKVRKLPELTVRFARVEQQRFIQRHPALNPARQTGIRFTYPGGDRRLS